MKQVLKIPQLVLLFFVFFVFLCISFTGRIVSAEESVSAENIKKAEQLGEEFQWLMPWSRKSPQSGAYYGMPQPESYFSTPERELPDFKEPYVIQYPYCYNPYTRQYEYCYPGYYYRDHYRFRLRFKLHLPKFYFYWGHESRCPPGFYFRPGWGCYKY